MYGRGQQNNTVCRFYQQGRCKFGDNCKYEHPGANRPPANQNPFLALGNNPTQANARNNNARPNGTAQAPGGDQQNQPVSFLVSKEGIHTDLRNERPQWPFSCYGPGRDAPRQLLGGPLEQSFEEMRLLHYIAQSQGNVQPSIQHELELLAQSQQQTEGILANLDGAVKYVIAAKDEHPNRLDMCQGPSNGAQPPPQTPFGAAAPSASAFGQPSSVGENSSRPAFGAPAFGAPSQPGATGGFGQPSALGRGSAFGQPSSLGQGSAFGQASALGQGSAFGQPSTAGQGGGFGQASALGAKPIWGQTSAPTQGSAFGQPSAPGQTGAFGAQPSFGQQSSVGQQPSPFGQAAQAGSTPAFGQPSQPANPAGAFGQSSAFGQPSSLGNNQQASAFGQPTAPANQGSAFGQPSAFGQQGSGQQHSASPFGAQSTPAQQQPSPFGQAGAAQPTSAFGRPAGASPFGQPAQTTNTSPFGQPAGPQTSPFGAAPQAAATQSPFGQPSQPQSNGIIATPNAGSNIPSGPLSSPDPSTYTTRGPNNTLTSWKNSPVKYIGDTQPQVPHYRTNHGFERIFHPNGPPPANPDTEDRPEVYDAALEAAYAFLRETGTFKDGIMPLIPPKREWIRFDV